MKETARLVGVLTVICLVAGLLLAAVYNATKSPIEEAKKREKLEALEKVLPAYDNVPSEAADASGSTSIASDSEVTLATITATAAQFVEAFCEIDDDVVFRAYDHTTASSPINSDELCYCVAKTATANQYQLRARQKDAGSANRTVKWRYRVRSLA